MNPRSNTVALLLSFIPGLGHLYLKRIFRAFLYGAGFFGPVALAFLIVVEGHGGKDFALILLLFAAACWVVNMIDMFITLGSTPSYPPPGYHDYGIPGHDNLGHGHGPGPGSVPEFNPAVYEWQRREERRKIILASFIPGLGHYMLGMMYRGLSAMTFFIGGAIVIFFGASLTHTAEFLFFLLALPVLWIYILFDAIRQLEKKQAGLELTDRTFFDDFSESRQEGRRSKTIATVLAVFPGAAHLYLGLQMRGLQIMAGFLFSIYIMDVLRLSLFLFLIPIFWFYSFFDALQLISRQEFGYVEDKPIFKGIKRHQRKIGFLIILVGLYYLTNEVLLDVLRRYYPDWHWPYSISAYFQTFIVALVLIGGGLTLLLNPPNRKS
ncbi:hypothetical protein [Paenibacillus sp. UNC499MF]|uniref:hypothetical protein n=1 Tax=Paenibacillus sp. UNC499MF TaxID=1502751 RepID=UPI0008A07812|nr:hypothetical protein [Paenibacillus sp. UNC499MF]SEG63010.1 hypothetical protein SAMN02799616_03919 [Paenibacillus sp. UNC499MF]